MRILTSIVLLVLLVITSATAQKKFPTKQTPTPATLIATRHPQFISGNNLLDPTDELVAAEQSPCAYTQQTLTYGDQLRANLNVGPQVGYSLRSFVNASLIRAEDGYRYGIDLHAGNTDFFETVLFAHSSSMWYTPGVQVYENAVLMSALPDQGAGVTQVQVKIKIVSSSRLEFYLNEGTEPFFVSTRAVPASLVGAFCTYGPGSKVLNITIN